MLRALRPSPSMIVAAIALFVSLGGVSYGVATGSIDGREIKNNTVRTQDVRNNHVRSRDLRNNDVRSRDLRNNEIRSRDLRNNEARSADIRNGTILGRDVGTNTLTSRNVAESRLAKVPAASTADVALSPLAFARVSSAGGVVEADSRGVADANVTREGAAFYCFRGLGFAFRSAQVTIDYAGDSRIAMVDKADAGDDCAGAGVQLKVVTADTGAASTPMPSGFYVWFYR
jgi:hypothetical protein